MVNEISNKMNDATSGLKNKYQGAEDQFSKLALNAGKKIGTMASDFADTTSNYMKTSREYVVENPVKGVAIAAAAGVVVGSLLSFSMRGSSKESK